ncbi:NAD(P) transhydrogenase subunit beta [Candidatus Photodesmus katoptron]|uniref:Re/Si-specific NAD(P)(+) transhydrogenase subunit beta n=1 Tax=Candidatus Photodesmus anomalopis TaxID=28176 RepID=UPI0004D8A622|nr:Re/Si-specific NAD(P)(+) transhydrogenase subunit beta [Candidatus Photodesmus katoptron]KEY90143.1 NAD(P) transhydrogenase subunit beta [Candidatus Photodesmus katoptron]
MSSGLVHTAYILAAVFFILSLAGLSKQKTARLGNYYGMAGMSIALIATIFSQGYEGLIWTVIAMLIGGTIGIKYTKKVEMTKIPELVAILHSFVGMAAILVGYNNYILLEEEYITQTEQVIHLVEIFLAIFIGSITFSGSLVAFGKLREILSSKPLNIPYKHIWNIAALLISIFLLFQFIETGTNWKVLILTTTTLISLAFGYHLVASIGGADMPVVISMLNSYSGWAAAATGFMLQNNLLIITGALVGSSGAILSYIMCKAMNRSFISVISGGFGQIQTIDSDSTIGKYYTTDIENVTKTLINSKSIIIVPGYGMAVAQAQYPVYEMTEKLRARNIDVKFAIHPVAGRLPGHMNVLLAEAKVPYDLVFEMDEINHKLSKTDTVLVIGANDTVNPAALEEENSLIAGMPVLKVWHARNVIILKRSMNTGYAGIQNKLFFKENTAMLFGDAKDNIEAISQTLSNRKN